MTNSRSLSFEKLTCEHKDGLPAPKKFPKALPLDELTTERGAFQMREEENDRWVADLHKHLCKGTGPLDPLLIWWTGRRWVVMDGHHRLEAYRKHAEGKVKYRKIPVKASQAVDPTEAMIEANQENAKDKLNTTPEDKSRQAWFFVIEGIGGSVREVAKATGTSKSTVGRMREAKTKLQARGFSKDRLMGLPWSVASELAKDKPVFDGVSMMSEDSQLHAEGERWAKRLRVEFAGKLNDAPDVAALMLLAYGRETTKRILKSRFLWSLRDEIEAEDLAEAAEEDETDSERDEVAGGAKQQEETLDDTWDGEDAPF